MKYDIEFLRKHYKESVEKHNYLRDNNLFEYEEDEIHSNWILDFLEQHIKDRVEDLEFIRYVAFKFKDIKYTIEHLKSYYNDLPKNITDAIDAFNDGIISIDKTKKLIDAFGVLSKGIE